mgnify:CR=1 FL=1
MCMVCSALSRGKYSAKQAKRKLNDIIESLDEDHVEEVENLIEEAENELCHVINANNARALVEEYYKDLAEE